MDALVGDVEENEANVYGCVIMNRRRLLAVKKAASKLIAVAQLDELSQWHSL